MKEQRAAERVGPAPVPIVMQDETRDGADHRVLYVLGFGIAGAIVTNATLFCRVVCVGMNEARS